MHNLAPQKYTHFACLGIFKSRMTGWNEGCNAGKYKIHQTQRVIHTPHHTVAMKLRTYPLCQHFRVSLS